MNAEDAERSVSIPLDRAVEAASLLESIVISLDRIGSRIASGDADAHTLDRFMTEWLVGPRLSQARFVLWDAIAEVLGEQTMEEIAESTPGFSDPIPDELHTLREQLRSRNQEQFGDT